MHRIGAVAKVTELALSAALELEAARAPRVAIPLRGGASGLLWRASQLCTAASLALSLGKRRRISGVLGTLGSLALRFALLAAGRRSARDPRAAFGQQRAQELEPRKADPLTAHAEAHP